MMIRRSWPMSWLKGTRNMGNKKCWKVGIMGAHGTGKTTLANHMAKTLGDTGIRTRVVSGAARACEGPINQNVTERTQQEIYHRHMLMELKAEDNFEAVFCDRTSLDSMVYAFVAGFTDLVRLFYAPALLHLTTYDELYWTRPREGWLIDDGIRDIDPEFQTKVDRLFDEWIIRHEIQVTEVDPDWE